jgi:hypothetical protein
MTTPDWLARRGSSVKLGSDGKTWYALLDGAPLYSLVEVPVNGKHGCVIRQTQSGQRIASSTLAATPEEAIKAGLEDLRVALGW